MNHNTFIAATFLIVLLLLAFLCIFDLAGGNVTISGIGDLLIGVATVIGATAAIVALDTWKKQRDADLAKRMATALYQYKLSLNRIRVPYLIPEDTLLAGQEGVDLKDLNFARLLRWRRSRATLQEVEALLAEADLHWPRQATDAFSDVLKVDEELFFAIQRLSVLITRELEDSDQLRVGHITEATWTERLDAQMPERLRLDALLEDTFAASDEMRQKIDASFGRIEAFVRDRI